LALADLPHGARWSGANKNEARTRLAPSFPDLAADTATEWGLHHRPAKPAKVTTPWPA